MLLKIDSATRFTGTCSSFKIRTNEPLSGQFRVRACYMPNSFYNVAEGSNTLMFADTQARVATVTPGFYSATTFAAALQMAMNSGGTSGYTVTYSPITGCLTLSGPSFSIQPSPLSVALSLGSSTGTSIVSGVVDLSRTSAYNFIITGASSNVSDVSSSTSWTFTVPCTVNSGDVQYTEFQHFAPSFSLTNTMTLEIRVVDANNVEIPLTLNWFLLVERC